MKYAARAIIERGDEILVMRRNKFGQEYYCLVGGAVDMGETAEQALVRELQEEASLIVTDFRLVYAEDAGRPYGIQYIYLCKDPGGEVYLSDASIEAQLNKQGQNLYFVEWIKKSKLAHVDFRSHRLQKALTEAFTHGYPDKPLVLEH